LKKAIILALVLIVFMFASTTVSVAINIPKINVKHTLNIGDITPLGDPIDGKDPPGLNDG
jgi:hypothetical protein